MSKRIDELRRSIIRINADLQLVRKPMDSLTVLPITQKELHKILIELSDIYWSSQLSSSDRKVLRRVYFMVLKTIKLIADDLFIESFAAIKAPSVRVKQTKEEVVHVEYIRTLQHWIKASPVLDRKSASNLTFSPPYRPAPIVTRVIGPMLGSPPSKAIGALTKLAKAALDKDVKAARSRAARQHKPFELRVKDETIHLFGLAFLLLQLRLIDESLLIPLTSLDIEFWYLPVVKLVEWTRSEIVDAIGVLERKALIYKKLQEANSFRKQRRRFQDELATVYSISSREVATLWTFLHKRRVGKRSMLQRKIVAPNRVTEYITSLPGRPNPDDQDNVGAKSVDALLNEQVRLQGEEVSVYGLKKTSRTVHFFLYSTETTKKVKVHFDARPVPGAYSRYVVVDGVLDSQGRKPMIEATKVDEFRVPYFSMVGMSLLFPQLSEGLITPEQSLFPLRLRPSWRSSTKALIAAATEEWAGGEGESLPESLAGQRALVTDLLYNSEIRDRFKSALKKSDVLDLHNRDVRVRAWQTMLEKFRQEKILQNGRKGAGLSELFELMQRYLRHYTRHTFWNIRDRGKNYLKSDFPQDVTGKVLYDCGVYAIQVAYDIFMTVNNVPNAGHVEFYFLVTADHVTLIGFVGKQWFMVNNRRIETPKPLPTRRSELTATLAKAVRSRTLTLREAVQAQAVTQAVSRGYRGVHNLRFNVVPFIRTLKPISTQQAEESFINGIWNAFLSVVGWKLAPPHSHPYYVEMQLFDKASQALQTAWDKIPKRANPAHPDVVKATTEAKQLFQDAEALVDCCRFIRRHFAIRQGGVSFVEEPRLPMYVVADALRTEQKKGATLSLAQQDLVKALPGHPRKLLNLWLHGSRKPCQ